MTETTPQAPPTKHIAPPANHLAPPAVPVAPLRAPEGTNPDTPWGFAVALVQLLGLFSFAFFDFASYFLALANGDRSQLTHDALSTYTSPGYALSLLLICVIYGLTVVFAWLDYRELVRRGVPKPFHWAFAFVPYATTYLYIIGRTVVVKRRTGRGLTTLWVFIGGVGITWIVTMIYVAVVVTQFMSIVDGLG